jgi:hypothetical protein
LHRGVCCKNLAGEPVSTEPKSESVSVADLGSYMSRNCDRAGRKCDPDTDSNMGLLIKHKLINKREEENSPTQNIFLKNEHVQNFVNSVSAEQKMSRSEIVRRRNDERMLFFFCAKKRFFF